MSTASDIFASGFTVLADVHGHSVSYATTYAGTYTALTGFLLIKDRPAPRSQDDDHGMQVQSLGGTLKGPLTPAMIFGRFIKDVGTGQIYTCLEPKFEAQQIARVEVVDPKQFGPDRKGAR